MVAERESITAKICAFARAWHSEYAQEKIYDDYLALKLMGKDEYNDIYKMIKNGLIDKKLLGNKETEEAIEKYFVPIPLSRIQFNENELDKFIEDNKEIQYVICGAGEDTFSFRNNNENIDIFEIDHPDTQRFKIEKIRKLGWNVPNNVRFVSVDFENEKMSEKLLKAGFDYNEIKCVLCSLGYNIDKYMSPQMIQNRYFDGRNDKLKAYENVSLIAADYIP
jgi:methyltransferase (TIGR00027 family)